MLIASDFDGTLSPIVAQPDAAAPLPGALDLLSRLAAHPRLRVAIVSGRALADLQVRCPVPGAWYVGGHGNESSGPEGEAHPPVQEPGHHLRIRQQLEPVAGELRRRAAAWPGTQIEAKPYSLAIHYRQAPQWGAAVEEAVSKLALAGGLRVMLGRQMAELLPAAALTKGQAVHRLRVQLGCDLAFYFGDDVTDEDVFHYHDAQIIGVKIAHPEGRRATAAAFQLASPREVLRALAAIEQAFPSIQEKNLRFSAVQP